MTVQSIAASGPKTTWEFAGPRKWKKAFSSLAYFQLFRFQVFHVTRERDPTATRTPTSHLPARARGAGGVAMTFKAERNRRERKNVRLCAQRQRRTACAACSFCVSTARAGLGRGSQNIMGFTERRHVSHTGIQASIARIMAIDIARFRESTGGSREACSHRAQDPGYSCDVNECHGPSWRFAVRAAERSGRGRGTSRARLHRTDECRVGVPARGCPRDEIP